MYILAAFLLPFDAPTPPTPPPPVAAAADVGELVGLVRGEDRLHMLVSAPDGGVVLLGDVDSPLLSSRLALLLDQSVR
ncbi:MAG: hypothetical protein ACI8S6_001198 [Myxococcota bacterium]|jgi:hypothetical protein